MLWIKVFHLCAVVTWFAGIFYLPRLFVYHTEASDDIGIARFKIMERRLHYGITTPSAIATTVLGIWLFSYDYQAYYAMNWMRIKLVMVALLWAYHFYCGHLVKVFARDENQHSSFFYRVFNELPVFLLVGIICMAEIQPF